MKIENEIISSVIAAVKELYGQDVPEKMVALQKTKSNFEGNLTLVHIIHIADMKSFLIQFF